MDFLKKLVGPKALLPPIAVMILVAGNSDFLLYNEGTLTRIILGITVAVSFLGFSKPQVLSDLITTGPQIFINREWYRFYTGCLIHADFAHLVFNMFTLYSFGALFEQTFFFAYFDNLNGPLLCIIVYIAAMVISSIPSMIQHKNDWSYATLGASGEISTVVAVCALTFSDQQILVFGIPMSAPLYLVLYLGISTYYSFRKNSRINHTAHLAGTVFGLAVATLWGLYNNFNPWPDFFNFLFN